VLINLSDTMRLFSAVQGTVFDYGIICSLSYQGHGDRSDIMVPSLSVCCWPCSIFCSTIPFRINCTI